MTAQEALQGLAAIVGAGGISGVLIGIYAYKTAALKGRGNIDGASVAMTIGEAFVPRATFEALTNAIVMQTAATNKHCALLEEVIKLEKKEADRLEFRLLIEEVLKSRKD